MMIAPRKVSRLLIAALATLAFFAIVERPAAEESAQVRVSFQGPDLARDWAAAVGHLARAGLLKTREVPARGRSYCRLYQDEFGLPGCPAALRTLAVALHGVAANRLRADDWVKVPALDAVEAVAESEIPLATARDRAYLRNLLQRNRDRVVRFEERQVNGRRVAVVALRRLAFAVAADGAERADAIRQTLASAPVGRMGVEMAPAAPGPAGPLPSAPDTAAPALAAGPTTPEPTPAPPPPESIIAEAPAPAPVVAPPAPPVIKIAGIRMPTIAVGAGLGQTARVRAAHALPAHAKAASVAVIDRNAAFAALAAAAIAIGVSAGLGTCLFVLFGGALFLVGTSLPHLVTSVPDQRLFGLNALQVTGLTLVAISPYASRLQHALVEAVRAGLPRETRTRMALWLAPELATESPVPPPAHPAPWTPPQTSHPWTAEPVRTPQHQSPVPAAPAAAFHSTAIVPVGDRGRAVVSRRAGLESLVNLRPPAETETAATPLAPV